MLREGERRDPIIAEVMQEKNIDPDDVLHFTTRPTCILYDPHNLDSVRGSQRYFRVRGFAWYRQHDSTTGCSRTWASAHSWGILDLREQKIVHRYGQECRTCGGKGTPSFSEEARGRMAEYACQQHLYRTKREQRPAVDPDMRDLSGQRDGPHDSSNCDMCKLLGNSCNNARDRPGWRDSSGWNACDTKKLGGSSGGSCNSRHRTSSQAGKGVWNLEYTSTSSSQTHCGPSYGASGGSNNQPQYSSYSMPAYNTTSRCSDTATTSPAQPPTRASTLVISIQPHSTTSQSTLHHSRSTGRGGGATTNIQPRSTTSQSTLHQSRSTGRGGGATTNIQPHSTTSQSTLHQSRSTGRGGGATTNIQPHSTTSQSTLRQSRSTGRGGGATTNIQPHSTTSQSTLRQSHSTGRGGGATTNIQPHSTTSQSTLRQSRSTGRGGGATTNIQPHSTTSQSTLRQSRSTGRGGGATTNIQPHSTTSQSTLRQSRSTGRGGGATTNIQPHSTTSQSTLHQSRSTGRGGGSRRRRRFLGLAAIGAAIAALGARLFRCQH